jgi:hypothetical protein
MSHIISGIIGAAAMSVAMGAVQYASGSSLNGSPAVIAAHAQSDMVNRSGKSDRVAKLASQPTRTFAVSVDGLTNASVLVRVADAPVAKKKPTETASDGPLTIKPAPSAKRSTVACEPVVSVLTDVAKLLGPGRCVT